DHEEDLGDREEDVDDPHQRFIDPASEEPGDRSDQEADEGTRSHDRDRYAERPIRPPQEPRVDVVEGRVAGSRGDRTEGERTEGTMREVNGRSDVRRVSRGCLVAVRSGGDGSRRVR